MTEYNKSLVNKIMHWILLGSLVVVAPFLYNILLNIIIGKTINVMDYLPDLYLVVVSVSCNIIYLVVDCKKKSLHIMQWVIGGIFGLIGLFCLIAYYSIRFNKDFISQYPEYVERAPFILCVLSIVIVLNVIVGSIFTFKKGKN